MSIIAEEAQVQAEQLIIELIGACETIVGGEVERVNIEPGAGGDVAVAVSARDDEYPTVFPVRVEL